MTVSMSHPGHSKEQCQDMGEKGLASYYLIFTLRYHLTASTILGTTVLGTVLACHKWQSFPHRPYSRKDEI